MTTELFKRGDVIRYPYRWQHNLIENPKDRPCCVAFTMVDREGRKLLVFAPISDQPPGHPDAAVKLTKQDIEAAGLAEHRIAYVHLNEVNVDRPHNSYTLDIAQPKLGRVSENTLRRIVARLTENLKQARVKLIDRGVI